MNKYISPPQDTNFLGEFTKKSSLYRNTGTGKKNIPGLLICHGCFLSLHLVLWALGLPIAQPHYYSYSFIRYVCAKQYKALSICPWYKGLIQKVLFADVKVNNCYSKTNLPGQTIIYKEHYLWCVRFKHVFTSVKTHYICFHAHTGPCLLPIRTLVSSPGKNNE